MPHRPAGCVSRQLPQISFFILGTVAFRRNWFRSSPNSLSVAGFVTALVASLLLFPLAFGSVLISFEFHFLGNGTWQSAVYALWDSFFAVGMVLAAIAVFRRFFNRESRFGRFLSQQSYAVYIIHSPIIVVLAYSLYRAYVLRGIDLGPLLKFSIATVIVVPTCFGVAYIIRRIPGVSRLL